MTLPDKTLVHRKTVASVEMTNKVINFQKQGLKVKYIITFTDGYVGEFLLPQGANFPGDKIATGKEMAFKIAYRSGTHPDEIELADVTESENTVFTGKSITMQGHPAVTALGIAKDLWMSGTFTTGTEDRPTEVEILETADLFYTWLLNKKNEG